MATIKIDIELIENDFLFFPGESRRNEHDYIGIDMEIKLVEAYAEYFVNQITVPFEVNGFFYDPTIRIPVDRNTVNYYF